MNDITHIVGAFPDLLASAFLVRGTSGWAAETVSGELDVRWATCMLTVGEGPHSSHAPLELVVQREDVHLVVSRGAAAIALRLPLDTDIRLALAMVHGQLETLPS